jgi:quinol monooxygenase YgiN
VPLVVVTRYVVPQSEAASFREQGRDALDALRSRPGCRRGHLGRSIDDPTRWLLQTEWDSIGAYRRALSSYEVKLRAVPLMYHAVDEVTAYEALVEATSDPSDGLLDHDSDRDPGAGAASLGRPRDR